MKGYDEQPYRNAYIKIERKFMIYNIIDLH